MEMLSAHCSREIMAKISLLSLLVMWWANCLRISQSFLSTRTDTSVINFTLQSSISNVLWHFNGAFSRGATAAMLVFLIKETATMSVFQTNLPGIDSILMQTLSFQVHERENHFPFFKSRTEFVSFHLACYCNRLPHTYGLFSSAQFMSLKWKIVMSRLPLSFPRDKGPFWERD